MPTGGEDVFRTDVSRRATDDGTVPGVGYGTGKSGNVPRLGLRSAGQMACVVVEDSLLVGAFIEDSPQRRHVLRLVDLRSGEVLDSLTDFYEYTLPFDDRKTWAAIRQVAASRSRLAIAYQDTDFGAVRDKRTAFSSGCFFGRRAGSRAGEFRSRSEPQPGVVRGAFCRLGPGFMRSMRIRMWRHWYGGEDRDVVVKCTIGQGAGWVRIVSTGKTSGW